MTKDCYFCNNSGGEILANCDLYRIILVANPDYSGYLQVVLNRHIKELSDLSLMDNLKLYQTVINCEQILRQIFQPVKINLASLGNITPHIHWHIIPRFTTDKHFPNSIWSDKLNEHYVKPLADATDFHQLPWYLPLKDLIAKN